jgi:3-methylfumaryl-CoA hydratase
VFDVSNIQPVTRIETCSVSVARRVAAMLDLSPDLLREGEALPCGWHFFLLGAETRRSELRADGFPGFGIPMPDLGLPRLLIGGRTVEYRGAIPIGTQIRRVSTIESLTHKNTPSGPMALLELRHELLVEQEASPAVVESQTYVLLAGQGRAAGSAIAPRSVAALRTKTIVPDETLLFQYSALGFNSHKIHIDKTFAREVEGFPDLVVNGGLTTLLLTEFARSELGLNLAGLRMKNTAPLFCGRPMTLAAVQERELWRLIAFDGAGTLAAEMEVNVR